MNTEMIIQIPAFNREYFKIGDTYRIEGKKDNYNALFLSFDKDRLCFVVVKYDSPMCGACGYKPDTLYVRIEDVLNETVKISKIQEE